MAELNTGDGGGKGKGQKVRSKKGNTKVDLTAMVDLAFLLITFFMLTTSLSKPQSMNLALPDKETDKPDQEVPVAQERTMTILAGPDNKLKMYMGQLKTPIEGPKDVAYGKDGIRKDILSKIKSVPAEMGDPKKGLIVIIKAHKKSNYRNLVDILDEMAICDVKIYAVVDITKEDEALFEK